MKTPENKILRITGLLCGLAFFFAASAHASQIVNFSGLYSTNGYTYFVLPTPVDSGGTRTWKYSDTTPITPAANYTGPAVYGAFQTQTTNGVPENMSWQTSLLKDGYSTTNTKLWAGGNSANSTLTAMFVFKPTVDLGQTVSFDATSSINYFLTAGSQGARFVLNNGGNWYISSNSMTLGASTNKLTGNSLLNSTWAAFDPVGVAPLPTFPASGYNSLGSSFDNIQGIGIYFNGARTDGFATYASLGGFTVDAAVVPEPESVALLLIAGGIFALRRLHRLRKECHNS